MYVCMYVCTLCVCVFICVYIKICIGREIKYRDCTIITSDIEFAYICIIDITYIICFHNL